MAEFVMSQHAVKRALDMCVDGEEIADAYHRPRDVSRAGAMKEYRTRGRVSVVVALDGVVPVVTTVLWATANGWVADMESDHASRSEWNEVGMAGVRSYRRHKKSRH